MAIKRRKFTGAFRYSHSFDENFIFDNCTQSGKFINFINNLPERLIEQYDARIKQLDEEVSFLHGLHNDKQ